MYGTVARMQVKPGMEADFLAFLDEVNHGGGIPGMVSEHLYQAENEPGVHYMAVVFENKAAYVANANDPAMHARYERYRAMLTAEPEWHDGEVVWPRA